jgi:homoserine dehydrogenase
MNAVVADAITPLRPLPAAREPRLMLLGTGTVGSAFVQHYERLRTRMALPPMAMIVNSRVALACAADGAQRALELARSAQIPPDPPFSKGGGSAALPSRVRELVFRFSLQDERRSETLLPASRDAAVLPPLEKGDRGGFAFDFERGCAAHYHSGPIFSKREKIKASLRAGDVIVDATASDEIAASHARWLRNGIHVVTANKLGRGADLSRALAIDDARREGSARYGDAATVGAGLPLLDAIRALVAGGDRIHAIEGVLSGSMAWLLSRYDGMRPFSGFVRDARAAGYTEPDPRVDLSGEDVRRKLLILARAAGESLEAADVAVESLVPPALASAAVDDVDALLPLLDAPLRARYQQAHRENKRLRFVARFECDGADRIGASVGLRALLPEHPLCTGGGTDNRVVIRSCRYDAQPLVIQGPGAGAEVTAAALMDDVLTIKQSCEP